MGAAASAGTRPSSDWATASAASTSSQACSVARSLQMARASGLNQDWVTNEQNMPTAACALRVMGKVRVLRQYILYHYNTIRQRLAGA